MLKQARIFTICFYLILTLPLVFTPFTMFPWGFGKTLLFQIIIEILLILFCILAIKEKKLSVRKPDFLDISLYIFLGVLLLTAFFGENFNVSFWPSQARGLGVFTWLHLGVFYFFLRNNLDEEKKWLRLFEWSVFVATVVGLSAVFQDYLPFAWRGDTGTRFSGIVGNPAFFASYVLMNMGMSFFLFIKEEKKKRWLFFGLGLFLSVCVIYSGIRGAFLGLVSGVLVVALGFLFVQGSKKKQAFRMGVLALCLILFYSIFFLYNRFELTRFSVLAPLGRLVEFSLTNGTGETRLMAWKIAWQGIQEKPILGWGWGNYEIVFNKYYNPQFLKYSFQETVWDKPHNALLEIFTSAGVFGLSLLLVFGGAVFFLFRSFRDLTASDQKARLLLFSTLLAYGVQSLFLFDTLNVLLPLFLCLAFISFLYKKEKFFSWSFVGIKRYGGVFVLGLFLFSLYKYNILSLDTSSTLRQAMNRPDISLFGRLSLSVLRQGGYLQTENAVLIAERLSKADRDEAITKEKIRYVDESALLAAHVLETNFKKYPANITYPVWAGQIYLVLGEHSDEKYYAQAIDLFEQAHKISPQKQEILFLLGRVYILQKNFVQALAAQEKAIVAAPTIGQSYWFFGLTKMASGDVAGGLRQVEEARQNGFFLTREQRLYIIDQYAVIKEYKPIIAEYEQFVSEYPNNVDWYVKLATAYALDGQKSKALETVRQAVLLYPPLAPDAEKFIKQYRLE